MLENVEQAVTYLLPGFVAYAIVYRLFVPGRRESELSLASKSLLWSLATRGVIGGYALVRGVQIDHGSSGTAIWAVAIACVSGAACGWLVRTERLDALYNRLGIARTWHPDVWSGFFDPSASPTVPETSADEALIVHVHTTDGRTFVGVPSRYTDDPNDPAKEVQLSWVWMFRAGSDEAVALVGDVLIPADSIVLIEKKPPKRASDRGAQPK
jgi:hypothetical protein